MALRDRVIHIRYPDSVYECDKKVRGLIQKVHELINCDLPWPKLIPYDL